MSVPQRAWPAPVAAAAAANDDAGGRLPPLPALAAGTRHLPRASADLRKHRRLKVEGPAAAGP